MLSSKHEPATCYYEMLDILISDNTPITNNMLEIAFHVICSQTIRVTMLLLLLLLIIVIAANILYDAYALSDTVQGFMHIN